MAKSPDLNAIVRDLLGELPRGMAVRTESGGAVLRVHEVAALAGAKALQELAGSEAVPRAWLVNFVKRVLPALETGYQNCGEDPDCIWAEPMMEARSIIAALEGIAPPQ